MISSPTSLQTDNHAAGEPLLQLLQLSQLLQPTDGTAPPSLPLTSLSPSPTAPSSLSQQQSPPHGVVVPHIGRVMLAYLQVLAAATFKRQRRPRRSANPGIAASAKVGREWMRLRKSVFSCARVSVMYRIG